MKNLTKQEKKHQCEVKIDCSAHNYKTSTVHTVTMDPLRTNSPASIGSLIGMVVVAPAETPPASAAAVVAAAAAVTGVAEPAVVPARAQTRVVCENAFPLNMEDDSTIPKNLQSHLNKTAGSAWSPVKTDDGRRQKQTNPKYAEDEEHVRTMPSQPIFDNKMQIQKKQPTTKIVVNQEEFQALARREQALLGQVQEVMTTTKPKATTTKTKTALPKTGTTTTTDGVLLRAS